MGRVKRRKHPSGVGISAYEGSTHGLYNSEVFFFYSCGETKAFVMRTAIRSDIGASVLRYLVAVWTVGLAFAVTLLMSPLVPPGVSPLFLLAVMIGAWRDGLGAGLLATALS